MFIPAGDFDSTVNSQWKAASCRRSRRVTPLAAGQSLPLNLAHRADAIALVVEDVAPDTFPCAAR